MREIYRHEADRVGIEWKGRIPTFNSIEIMADDDSTNIVNRSMTYWKSNSLCYSSWNFKCRWYESWLTSFNNHNNHWSNAYWRRR